MRWVVLVVVLAGCSTDRSHEPNPCVQIEEEFYQYLKRNYQATASLEGLHRQMKACLGGDEPAPVDIHDDRTDAS